MYTLARNTTRIINPLHPRTKVKGSSTTLQRRVGQGNGVSLMGHQEWVLWVWAALEEPVSGGAPRREQLVWVQ